MSVGEFCADLGDICSALRIVGASYDGNDAWNLAENDWAAYVSYFYVLYGPSSDRKSVV